MVVFNIFQIPYSGLIDLVGEFSTNGFDTNASN